MQGTIKKKLDDKKFGFISVEGGGKDVFFHADQTNGEFDNLREGDVVTFEVTEGPKGPAAANVQKVQE